MIEWRDDENRDHRGSLLAAFAALACGKAWSFPALRPHQREPWHSFTVQVAALALIRAGLNTLPDGEAAWRDLLIGLTPEWPDGEAWELIVEDWSKPALLQPPTVAATDRAAYKNRLATPDALDMLVTAKNHDVKQERMVGASEQDWLFALVTLQTTEGFLGAGNYGVSRMNGGFASRMSLGVRPGGGAAAGFRRDVLRLVEHARTRPERRGGIPLLWTVPWDGTVSLNYGDLDELYVEICRRVRLERAGDGAITARAAGSRVSRVAYKKLGGNTLDPWAPLTIDKKKDSETYGQFVSFTVQAPGFDYKLMSRLMGGKDIVCPLLADPSHSEDRDGLSIVAAALVRGQGKTEGLHRRSIPVNRWEAISTYGDSPFDRIGVTAEKRAGEASEASRRLGRALISLVQGGPEKARFDDDAAKKKTERWLEQFNCKVDGEFFDPPFWAEAAGDKENHRLLWRTRLRAIADDVFDKAAEAAPRTEVRRIRAIAQARSYLDRQMGKWMKDVQHGE